MSFFESLLLLLFAAILLLQVSRRFAVPYPTMLELPRLAALARHLKRLELPQSRQAIGANSYLVLQEELDFKELAPASEEQRHIEES